jgi:hypothetical protein
MDVETIEFCWNILQQYIKDKGHAVDHLVNELLDSTIADEDIAKLKRIDAYFKSALDEYNDDFGADEDWEE